jgi:DNA-binding MarR family transcriptional regulator
MERSILDEAGLSLRWYDVMLELAAASDHRLRMSDLAQRVVLSRTRVSRVVDELHATGFVIREPHEADGRSAYAVLTTAGLAAFKTAAPIYRRAIVGIFAGLATTAELTVIRDVLDRAISEGSSAP